MSGRPNNAGIYQFDNLNAQTLFIKGKRFEDYINELVFEDQLEQSEINEIKLLLEYLDTTGLNSAWLVNNGNTNETLRASITALQTKLANLDTTALTESSVLTNDNRNSVLKTRLDTAEGDIDAAETNITAIKDKTDYIVVTNGDPQDNTTTHGVFIGNKLSVPTDATKAAKKVATLSVGRNGQGFAVEYDPSIATPSALGAGNRIAMQNTFGGHAIVSANYTRIQGGTEVNIGEVGLGVAGYETINIGGKMATINIGSQEDPDLGTTPGDPATGKSTKIVIGKNATLKNTWTYLAGNFYTNDARWENLPRTDKFTFAQLLSLIPTTGLPLWVVSFALTSSIPNFEYSDVLVLKDGGTAENKTGEMTTSNNLKTEGLVIFNKSLNIAQLTPVEGTFLARGTISKTTLDGSIRNSVFLNGTTSSNVIALKHHNIAPSDITEWATTEANSKVNVVEIGGNSGILIHQGASNAGTDLKLINTKGGNIVLKCGATNGILGDAKDSFTVLHDANYPGAAIGRLSPQAFATDETERINNPIARLEIDCIANRKGIRLFGYNTTPPYALSADETTLTNQQIITPTATATSLVINGNYTGNTDARLYKNADNKLMWNGEQVGAGGVSSGGITYMINVASNITNPSPTPIESIITAAYSGTPQRTITQAITANTAYYIAKYTTEVFDETSNPILTGLQQLNQYIQWNSQNQVGQIYGQLWFQATAVGSATLYQRTYASPVSTTAAQLINGTPIPTPKGFYTIKFQRVVFPNINVVVSSGPVVLRFRVEGLISNSWTTIAMSPATGQSVSSTTNNLTVSLDETIDLNQTTAGVASALRLVLFIHSGTGTISQTSAGGADLGAYSLIAVGSNTPGLFRTMLYDGTNAKITVPYSTTPTLVEYDLAIDAPYNVSAFPTPTLSTDLYFIQPAGGFANHAITLYFNEGTISHYHSTISPPQTIPTLAQVLNSGATANQAINMNTNKISGITALEGSSGVNWNVREITAGTNISVSSSSGNYTITNNAPTQEVAGGTGIQIATNGKTSTIINNAAVQNVTAGTGISIAVDTPTRNATITNTGILSVSAGTGILVSTTNGVATITNTASAGGQAARDQLSATSSVGLVPNKLPHYAENWTTESVPVQPQDIFVSQDGRNCVYIPAGSSNNWVQYSLNYGSTWTNTNVWINNFVSICGSTTGEVLYITRFGPTTGSAPNVVYTSHIYASYNYGLFWTELSLDRTPGAANTWYNRFINQIRCSADGTVVIASTIRTTSASGVPNDGTLYISTNGGASWVVRNIAAGPAQVADCCMSANGAIMFAAMNGVLGGATDNGNGGIYRSFDFGATWTKVRNQIAAGTFFFGIIKCDATGRFLCACDISQTQAATGQIQTSDDYGSTWAWFGDEMARGATAAFVSPGGNLMITAHDPTYNSRIRYSIDYGRNWANVINFDTVFTVTDNLNGATLRTLASNHDGSVLLMRASAAAIYRSIEERGRLAPVVGSRDLTITPAFGGGYTLLSSPTYTLWTSSVLTTSNTSVIALTFQAIDLTQFNIQYEFDINWNHAPSGTTISDCFIEMNVNGISTASIPLPQGQTGAFPAQTNWTNAITEGNTTTVTDFNQSFRQRFFTGFAPLQVQTTTFRNRTRISGELSLSRRITGESGITDNSINSRQLLNKFNCDNSLIQNISTTQWYSYAPVNSGSNEWAFAHQRIHGTAIWELSAGDFWSAGPAPFSAGISNLTLFLSTLGYVGVARSAETSCRIYRVRK